MNRRAFFTGAASVAITTDFTGPKSGQKFARGGLVGTSTKKLVGEFGPEAIIPLQQMEESKDLIAAIAEFKEQISKSYYIPNRLLVPSKLMPVIEKITASDLVQVFDWEPINVNQKEIWRGIDD